MVNKKRVQVELSKDAVKELEGLRDSLNLGSVADVIRSSLKMRKYLDLEQKAGNEVILRNKKTKREKEVVFGI